MAQQDRAGSALTDTTCPCELNTACTAGPELGARGGGAPNIGVNSTMSFAPVQSVFWRGWAVA
jgi:hypothetical protein